MLIYAAKNTVNGKLYVGLTTLETAAARWRVHLWHAEHGGQTALYRAMRKYGPDAFIVEEVARLIPGASIDDLRQLERDIIAQEGCMVPAGYNLTAGGEGVLGLAMSLETRAKIVASKARRKALGLKNRYRGGKVLTEQHKRAIGAGVRASGHRHSPEVQARVLEAAWAGNRGKPSKNRGRVASLETREKQSAAWSDERRAAASERLAKIAKNPASWSPERRAARAESMRAFHAAKRAPEERVN